MKTIDVAELSVQELHQYLQAAISPRPIALVSTISCTGDVNLSPFSFFNLFSTNPPICIFSPSRRVRDNTTKHTLKNLQEVPECVIHVVTYAMVQQTSLASSEYPIDVNEFKKAGFTPLASELVRPPRVAESPIQMECRVNDIIALGHGPGAGNLVLAEIVRLHINEKILDGERRIDQQKLDSVARLGGDWYTRITKDNLFKVPKPVSGLGIGVDSLPEYIRNSAVLTGNELAMLANVREIPNAFTSETYLITQTDLHRQMEYLSAFPESRFSFIHQRAKTLLSRDNLQEAWLTLLAGALYEEQLTKL